MSKKEEVGYFIRRKTRDALGNIVLYERNRGLAENIRQASEQICREVAESVCREYSFLELADIMEWKKTRVRR